MTTHMAELDELKELIERDAAAERIVEHGLGLVRILSEDLSLPGRLHPLGFLQILLGAYEHFSLRLHVWPIPSLLPKEPAWKVHLHGWALRSYVLRGAAVNIEYDVVPEPGGPARLYEVHYEPGVSILERTGSLARCRERSRQIHGAPTVYEIAARSFHATECLGDEPTATLVVAATEKLCPPLVVGEMDGRATYARPMEMLSGSSVRRRLTQLL